MVIGVQCVGQIGYFCIGGVIGFQIGQLVVDMYVNVYDFNFWQGGCVGIDRVCFGDGDVEFVF